MPNHHANNTTPLLIDTNHNNKILKLPFKDQLEYKHFPDADFIPGLGLVKKNAGHYFISGSTRAGKSHLCGMILELDQMKPARPIYLYTDHFNMIDKPYERLIKKGKMKIVIDDLLYRQKVKEEENKQNNQSKQIHVKKKPLINIPPQPVKYNNVRSPNTFIIKEDVITKPFRIDRMSSRERAYNQSGTELKYKNGHWYDTIDKSYYSNDQYKQIPADWINQNQQIYNPDIKIFNHNMNDPIEQFDEPEVDNSIKLSYYTCPTMQIDGKDKIKNCIVVFDDSTNPLAVIIKNNILTKGSKSGVICIVVEHDLRGGHSTKTSHNDSEWIISFPKSNYNQIVDYLSQNCRMTIQRIEEIMTQAKKDGDNIFIHKWHPNFIASNKSVWMM